MEKKNLVIVCLCAAIAIMAVAYAAFTTTIDVSGTVYEASNFSINFTNVACTGTPAASNTTTPTGVATANGTTVTFTELKLYSPSDVVECDVTVVNDGNLAADYASHTATNGIKADSSPVAFEVVSYPSTLAVGGTGTIKLKFTYDPDITEQPKEVDYDFEATFIYTQLVK